MQATTALMNANPFIGGLGSPRKVDGSFLLPGEDVGDNGLATRTPCTSPAGPPRT